MRRLLLIVALAWLPHAAAAQPHTHPDSLAGPAREVMERARFAVLVTLGPDGHPHARVMDPFAPDEGFAVWLATHRASRKVQEIRGDPRVTLVYFDAAGPGYVALLGTAEVVEDPAERAARWKPEWARLYQDENRGDDYLLIRVVPSRLEVVSYRHGIVNAPGTWAPPVLDLP